ncbi:MAG TPA: S1 RNA-binding domain-containing protein [Anaerolineales bacterium]|nr:S1 RNA-binding domain-containing protein [Anaerolineales bacterium]
MPKENPTSGAARALSELKEKMPLEGTVSRIDLSGAFIDVGVEREGFAHISALAEQHVNRVEDVLKVGQKVSVWVRKVDAAHGRLELTLVKPLEVEWNEIKKGSVVPGKVVRLEKFGAFVEIGAERPGLIHISELANGYVKDPAEVVKVGDAIEVMVLGVDHKKKQIQLSLKALETRTAKEVEEEQKTEEPSLTAMQAAFLKAQGSSEATLASAADRPGRGSSAKIRREQEEILSRTLQGSTRK